MKAITLNNAGEISDLKLTEVKVPELKDNEVLIKMKATSINPVDAKARKNQQQLDYFFKDEKPYILGWDASGVIIDAGFEVAGLKAGDEVFGMVNFPGNGACYAEYVAAPFDQLALKPFNITHEDAASACLAALTAWQSLKNSGNIKTGDKVLIHAASGGVGHYAVQIAKYLGAYVIGTSSAQNRDFVLKLGADEHIDYKTQNFEDLVSGADIVLDLAGGNAERSAGVTKKGGIIICVPEKLSDEKIAAIKKQGVNVDKFMVQSNGGDMQKLADMLGAGSLKTHIDQTFTFKQIPEGQAAIEGGKTTGKIAVTF